MKPAPGSERIDKLTGPETWQEWKMLMLLELETSEFDDVVFQEQAEEALADKTSEIYKKDLNARKTIMFAIDRSQLHIIKGATTAFQIWSKLVSAF